MSKAGRDKGKMGVVGGGVELIADFAAVSSVISCYVEQHRG